jgi:Calcineurin-like phosphoesterase
VNLQEANNLVHEHRRPQVESNAFAQPGDGAPPWSSSWQALYFTHDSDAAAIVNSQLLVSVPRDKEHFIVAPEQVVAYALAQASRWPGLVFWREGATTTFVPCTPDEVNSTLEIDPRNSIFSLTTSQPSPATVSSRDDVLIVHLSDLHVGSGHAGDRCIQLLRMVKQLRASRPQGSLICVVSGDLVDSPNELSTHTAADFIDLLRDVSGSHPIVVPGNHDVRRRGLWGDHQRFPSMASPVTPFAGQGVCFVALDSVREHAVSDRPNGAIPGSA